MNFWRIAACLVFLTSLHPSSLFASSDQKDIFNTWRDKNPGQSVRIFLDFLDETYKISKRPLKKEKGAEKQRQGFHILKDATNLYDSSLYSTTSHFKKFFDDLSPDEINNRKNILLAYAKMLHPKAGSDDMAGVAIKPTTSVWNLYALICAQWDFFSDEALKNFLIAVFEKINKKRNNDNILTSEHSYDIIFKIYRLRTNLNYKAILARIDRQSKLIARMSAGDSRHQLMIHLLDQDLDTFTLDNIIKPTKGALLSCTVAVILAIDRRITRVGTIEKNLIIEIKNLFLETSETKGWMADIYLHFLNFLSDLSTTPENDFRKFLEETIKLFTHLRDKKLSSKDYKDLSRVMLEQALKNDEKYSPIEIDEKDEEEGSVLVKYRRYIENFISKIDFFTKYFPDPILIDGGKTYAEEFFEISEFLNSNILEQYPLSYQNSLFEKICADIEQNYATEKILSDASSKFSRREYFRVNSYLKQMKWIISNGGTDEDIFFFQAFYALFKVDDSSGCFYLAGDRYAHPTIRLVTKSTVKPAVTWSMFKFYSQESLRAFQLAGLLEEKPDSTENSNKWDEYRLAIHQLLKARTEDSTGKYGTGQMQRIFREINNISLCDDRDIKIKKYFEKLQEAINNLPAAEQNTIVKRLDAMVTATEDYTVYRENMTKEQKLAAQGVNVHTGAIERERIPHALKILEEKVILVNDEETKQCIEEFLSHLKKSIADGSVKVKAEWQEYVAERMAQGEKESEAINQVYQQVLWGNGLIDGEKKAFCGLFGYDERTVWQNKQMLARIIKFAKSRPEKENEMIIEALISNLGLCCVYMEDPNIVKGKKLLYPYCLGAGMRARILRTLQGYLDGVNIDGFEEKKFNIEHVLKGFFYKLKNGDNLRKKADEFITELSSHTAKEDLKKLRERLDQFIEISDEIWETPEPEPADKRERDDGDGDGEPPAQQRRGADAEHP